MTSHSQFFDNKDTSLLELQCSNCDIYIQSLTDIKEKLLEQSTAMCGQLSWLESDVEAKIENKTKSIYSVQNSLNIIEEGNEISERIDDLCYESGKVKEFVELCEYLSGIEEHLRGLTDIVSNLGKQTDTSKNSESAKSEVSYKVKKNLESNDNNTKDSTYKDSDDSPKIKVINQSDIKNKIKPKLKLNGEIKLKPGRKPKDISADISNPLYKEFYNYFMEHKPEGSKFYPNLNSIYINYYTEEGNRTTKTFMFKHLNDLNEFKAMVKEVQDFVNTHRVFIYDTKQN